MQRIAAPMVGGMITAPLLSMLVIPAAYLLLRRRALPARPALVPGLHANVIASPEGCDPTWLLSTARDLAVPAVLRQAHAA